SPLLEAQGKDRLGFFHEGRDQFVAVAVLGAVCIANRASGTAFLFLSTLNARHPPTKTAKATIKMIIVASALTSGLTPRRTFEKITIGRVVEPGPETKLEMTRSSTDRVKARSQPDRSAGDITGRVTSVKTRKGVAPRSCAASSNDSSILASRD